MKTSGMAGEGLKSEPNIAVIRKFAKICMNFGNQIT